LETTIPSYLTSNPSRDLVVAAHQRVTHEWWAHRRDAFQLYVSQFVVDEAAAGDVNLAEARLQLMEDLPLLAISPEVGVLAAAILDAGALPRKSATDAAHIAVAAVHGMDFLLTWNCSHIANAVIGKAVARVCGRYGYSFPAVCTPLELMSD